jgi:cytochrome P450 family 6
VSSILRYFVKHANYFFLFRSCIGMRYGLMQSKLALIKLLLKFKFSTCEKTTIPMKLSPTNFSLSAINGIWLEVEKI